MLDENEKFTETQIINEPSILVDESAEWESPEQA
jgi:hypothetical protein